MRGDKHLAVVRALSEKPRGMSRPELIKHTPMTSGGTATKVLEELTESGFVTGFIPFGRRERDIIYRLTDEYSRFYLKFMANHPGVDEDAWNKQAISPAWRSWSGTAFEDICLKHTYQIKQALGISGVHTAESPWHQKGVQIELLIDRQDFCINVCEIKFSTGKFTINKKYGEELQSKVSIFREATGTSKNLFLTFVTTFGLADNANRLNLVQSEVTMDALFAPKP